MPCLICSKLTRLIGLVLLSVLMAGGSFSPSLRADEPPAINPFGKKPQAREDAIPGYVEMSDGTITVGQIYLTRDVRLKMFDESLQREREIPLRPVREIKCHIKKEWLEKEWRFKELASDEKYFTGRHYPTREYLHTIILRDGREITGALSGIVFVKPEEEPNVSGSPRRRVRSKRFFLHKRDKGKIGTDLKSLLYTQSIKLGDEAFEEGKKKIARKAKEATKKKTKTKRTTRSSSSRKSTND